MISDIRNDRKLEEIKAFEKELKAESFVNIIDKTADNIFGISYLSIQSHFDFILEELNKQNLTEIIKREFKLDKVKARINDGVLGLKVVGQNKNIGVIQIDVENGRQGNKSFVLDSVETFLKRLAIKRIKIDWDEDKYFRWFDIERAKKIIEVENQWGSTFLI